MRGLNTYKNTYFLKDKEKKEILSFFEKHLGLTRIIDIHIYCEDSRVNMDVEGFGGFIEDED